MLFEILLPSQDFLGESQASEFFEVPQVILMYSQDLDDLDDLLVSGEVIQLISSLKLKGGMEVVENSKVQKEEWNSSYLLLQNLTELTMILLKFWKLVIYDSGHNWI